MKRFAALAILFAGLLSGCAYNFGFDASKANDFAWTKTTSSWKIASDYYTLKNKNQNSTVHTTGYFYPKINKVDPRLLEYYEIALAKKGYTAEQISSFGNTHISEKMPTEMQAEWTADTPTEFIAADLLLLIGHNSGLRRPHPNQKFLGLPGRYSTDTAASAKLCLDALIRKGWPDESIKSLIDGKLCVGMPEAGARALWGKPYDIMEHTSSFGVLKQYQYGGIYFTKSGVNNNLRYIHILNGAVTSWTEL